MRTWEVTLLQLANHHLRGTVNAAQLPLVVLPDIVGNIGNQTLTKVKISHQMSMKELSAENFITK